MDFAVVNEALVFPQRRPRRRWIARAIRHYPVITSVTLVAIVFLSTWTYSKICTLGAILVYGVYFGARWFLERSKWKRLYTKDWLQLGRALFIYLGVLVWLSWVSLTSSHPLPSEGGDTLWLLLVPAIFIVCQRGNTWYVIGAVFLAAVYLVAFEVASVRSSLLPEGGLDPTFVFMRILVKPLWLFLLSLTLYVLVRYIGDLRADIQSIDKLEEGLHRILEKKLQEPDLDIGEDQLLACATNSIASDLRTQHVNVFQATGNELKFAAGACPIGKSLAQEGFSLVDEDCAAWEAAKTGNPSLPSKKLRNLSTYPRRLFPTARSALAVPIKTRSVQDGVLEVLADYAGFFLEQDVYALQVRASHIGHALDIARMQTQRIRIGKLIEDIAGRFLSRTRMKETLQEIAQAACDELSADVVILFVRDPETDEVRGPEFSGNPWHREILEKTTLEPDSVIFRLLSGDRDFYFLEDLRQLAPDHPVVAPSGFHIRTGRSTFIEREGIKAVCCARLKTETGCVGLMFLNFRTAQVFGDLEKELFPAFANLAALAIQKSLFHQQQAEGERASLAQHVHDSLMSHICGISDIIWGVLEDAEFPPQYRESLRIASEAARDLKRDVKYLNGVLESGTLGSLREEVVKLVRLTQQAYGKRILARGLDATAGIPAEMVPQLRLILNEAILNAVKYSGADQFELGFWEGEKQFVMVFLDHGRGFDLSTIARTSGIAHMKDRAKRIGGLCSVESKPGQGTTVKLALPRISSKGQDK